MQVSGLHLFKIIFMLNDHFLKTRGRFIPWDLNVELTRVWSSYGLIFAEMLSTQVAAAISGTKLFVEAKFVTKKDWLALPCNKNGIIHWSIFK